MSSSRLAKLQEIQRLTEAQQFLQLMTATGRYIRPKGNKLVDQFFSSNFTLFIYLFIYIFF